MGLTEEETIRALEHCLTYLTDDKVIEVLNDKLDESLKEELAASWE